MKLTCKGQGLFFICALVLGSSAVFANDPLPSECLEYMKGPREFEEISKGKDGGWSQLPAKGAVFGYSDDIFWFKLSRECLPTHLADLTLQISYPLEQITAYFNNPNGKWNTVHLGELKRPSGLLPMFRDQLLPLHKLGRSDLFLKVQSRTSIQVPLSIRSTQELVAQETRTHLCLGIFFGLLLFGFLSSLFQFFWLKNRIALLYAAFLFFYGLGQFSINRFLQTYLFPDYYWINLHAVPITVCIALGFFFLFSRKFLNAASISKYLDYGYLVCATFCFIQAVLACFLPYRLSLVIGHAALFLFILMSLTTTAFALRFAKAPDSRRALKRYLLAWCPFLSGFLCLVAKALGFLPFNWITNYGPQAGILFAIVLFSFIIADRFEHSRADAAQEEKRELLEREEKKRLLAIEEASEKVSHDIKSPIAVVRSIETDLSALPEEIRTTLRNAINRIDDIAFLLSKSDRGGQTAISTESKKMNPELLSTLIETLLSEKRAEYRSRSEIKIYSTFENSTYGIFVKLNTAEFKRVLSNLINNSMEAITGAGNIRISLSLEQHDAIIRIKDNGHGISQKIVGRLGLSPVSDGKQNGKGLGLFQAFSQVNQWGGKLEIEETSPQGTMISIRLKCVVPPEWFGNKIVIAPHSTVIALDDDKTVHHIWKNRISSTDFTLIQFSKPEEFEEHLKSHSHPSDIFLIDYELLGYAAKGLDLVAKFGLTENTFLVTSRFEDEDIRKRCLDLGVKLIPKNLAGFVPIEVLNSSLITRILVDDEVIIREVWKMKARNKGFEFFAFSSGAELSAHLPSIPKNAQFFIDYHLENETGADLSRNLFELGFKDLHITSGQDHSRLPAMPWVRTFQSKTAPW